MNNIRKKKERKSVRDNETVRGRRIIYIEAEKERVIGRERKGLLKQREKEREKDK